ncbi:hypothetical protein EIP91_005820 [Steccherinum ochraceum]|uniref:PHP domain-like protein n=1 Tax=Steccherinum ochraceum TaxID=92696 RepID=A0A4R0RCP5_9APHY|nr:hypothetical protein EIP91_005820 [Steccherinum ochraceum]
MYIDLNVPVPLPPNQSLQQQSKKGKGKQVAQTTPAPAVTFTPGQLTELEARIDFLTHLGYSVLGFNQTVQRKVDPKTHVNILDPLLSQLRKRDGIVYVKRLTIVLDEDSEKGFGLTTSSASLFAPYDIIALLPTTAGSFSLACLTHTLPSTLTAHIISLPLTLPRLPFNLKHTLVKTAIKNGAVFEIPYAGALGSEPDPALGSVAAGESGSGGKRNWWAAAREVVRVTKGKGFIVTSGAVNQTSLRAPKDVGNLITMLDLAQNLAHDASTKTPQALILRAQTRRTYRAILSEPRIVLPDGYPGPSSAAVTSTNAVETTESPSAPVEPETHGSESVIPAPLPVVEPQPNGKKRSLEPDAEQEAASSKAAQVEEGSTKKKRKKNKSKDATST